MPKLEISDDLIAKAKNIVSNDHEGYADLSPLQKHVYAFGKLTEDGQLIYNYSTIAERLAQHKENYSTLVGCAVFTFNAVHSGQCPYGSARFSQAGQNDFGVSLHLGTLRLYSSLGTFSEGLWEAFADNHEEISLTYLNTYLAEKNNEYPEEQTTGRNTHSFFSSRYAQETAGSKAWGEVFKILASDWEEGMDGQFTPLVDARLLKLFFEDTLACLHIAKSLDLPVPQPTLAEANTPVMS